MPNKVRSIFLALTVVAFLVAANAKCAEKAITGSPERKPEGTIIIALQSLETQAWHTYLGATAPMMMMMTPVYDSLLQWGPNVDELRPMLAEKWTISSDGKTFDFYLRKGIQFHDGWGEFTAEDVKFSLEQTKEKGSRATRRGQFDDLVADIQIIDRYHVRTILKIPSAEWVWMLSTWLQDQPIYCKKYVQSVGVEKAGVRPIGTGPYKFVEQKMGQYAKLEALDKHFRVTPYYKYILFKIVPEPRMALAMVQKGEADFCPIPLNFVREAKKGGVKIFEVPESGQLVCHFGGMYIPEVVKDKYDPSCPWVPFIGEKSRKVRLALEMAIDKEAIRQRVLSGYIKHQAQFGFPNDSVYSDSSWKPIPYDPKRAKELLIEAGYPKGFAKPITMWQMIMPGKDHVSEVAEALAQYWERNLGLKVNRRAIEYGPVKAAWRDRSDSWICYTYQWQGPYPEPYMSATRIGLTTISSTLTGMDPRIDELCKKIGAELNDKKRADLNRQFGQIWYDYRAVISLGLADTLYAVSAKIGHWDREPRISMVHNLEYLRP